MLLYATVTHRQTTFTMYLSRLHTFLGLVAVVIVAVEGTQIQVLIAPVVLPTIEDVDEIQVEARHQHPTVTKP